MTMKRTGKRFVGLESYPERNRQHRLVGVDKRYAALSRRKRDTWRIGVSPTVDTKHRWKWNGE
jgi:hypothetical protein